MNLVPFKNNSRTITRIHPFNLIEDLQSDLNRFFDSSLMNLSRDISEPNNNHWLPSTDIHDLADKLVIKSDLPGLDKNDIDVSIQGNTLFIRGEKKHEEKVQDSGFLRSERYFGHFERALPLSNDIDTTKIDAQYKNGVLSITIPKKEEARPKQISINIK